MPRIGPTELIIILVIILIIFGAGRLADIGGSLGKGLRSFKRGISGDDEAAQNAKATQPAADKDKTKS